MTGGDGSESHEDIPRRIHVVWLGSPPRPELIDSLAEFALLNPGWEVKLWRDDDLGWLRNRALYEAAPTYSGRANVARYEIVFREGGVYLDADFVPRRGFDAAGYPRCGLVVCRERPGMVAPGMFAAPAGHPFLGQLIDALSGSVAVHKGASTMQMSGPVFFTSELQRWTAGGGNGVTEVARDLFYPYSFDKLERGAGPWSPQVIAVHHWGQARHGLAHVGSPTANGSVLAQWRSRAARIRTVGPARVRHRLAQLAWAPRSVPLGDGMVLVRDRGGRPRVIDVSDPESVASLAARHEGSGGSAFVRRHLSGSDVFVAAGDARDDAMLTAAGALSDYGRVFAFPSTERGAQVLRKTFEVQRLAGWISAETHVDVAGSRTDSIGDRLDFLSHVRMLTAAGPDAYDILEGARNLIDSGRVDLVVVRWMRDELGADVDRAGAALARWVNAGATLAAVDERGRTTPMTGDAEAQLRFRDVPNLVLDLGGLRTPPARSDEPGRLDGSR